MTVLVKKVTNCLPHRPATVMKSALSNWKVQFAVSTIWIAIFGVLNILAVEGGIP